MEETKTQKPYLMIGIVTAVIVILVIGGMMIFGGKKQSSDDQGTGQKLQNSAVVPTVDASVKVGLEISKDKKEAVLTLSNLPKGTKNMDFTLSYTTSEKEDGSIGSITTEDSKSSYERKITFGTCSSGVCRYNPPISPVKLIIDFTGSYGERIFEKEYTL